MKTQHAFTQFVVLLSLPLLLGGCGEKEPVAEVGPVEEKEQEVKTEEPLAETKPELEGVVFKELERREGIAYLKGSDTPYTGKVFILHENGQKKLQGNYKNGKRDGLSTPFHPISEPFNGDLKRLTQKANS